MHSLFVMTQITSTTSLKACLMDSKLALAREILSTFRTGKAAYAMVKDMSENPKKWEGRKILFIHTGGLLGLYDKVDQLASFVGNWQRMDVNESVPKHDGIGKMF
ncbi:hypothetical protein AAZX31_08G055700 [Glycine max]|nr:hypothetical protein GLYMA_08G057251v4 [Glycine max]KAG5024655.1 hypothetical protein JHK86_020569 [Glycine max]KAG5135824.1 hypothetical protein JHK82_020555 [Glycine max]KAH1049813.1 hypothetical protein GYH30_020360 [Glycine max]